MTERQIHLRIPSSISGRLGIGAMAWAELEDAERRGIRAAFAPTSGVCINWRTFRAVMNALRHCGEQHYLNPEPAGLLGDPEGPREAEKLVLDSYGRRCYDAGYEAALKAARKDWFPAAAPVSAPPDHQE